MTETADAALRLRRLCYRTTGDAQLYVELLGAPAIGVEVPIGNPAMDVRGIDCQRSRMHGEPLTDEQCRDLGGVMPYLEALAKSHNDPDCISRLQDSMIVRADQLLSYWGIDASIEVVIRDEPAGGGET